MSWTNRLRAAAILFVACSNVDTVATGTRDGGETKDGTSLTADAGLWETYCDGEGPPVFVGDGGEATDVCSGDVTEATFEYAICSCADILLSSSLFTDSFNSDEGPYAPGGNGGSVASNGAINSNATIEVHGDIASSGSGGVSVASVGTVSTNLSCQGNLGTSTAAIAVGGDATVGGDIDLDSLSVSGTLVVPGPSQISVAGTNSIGTLVRAPVTVAPPCECADDQLLDIDGFVVTHRDQNHNATINIDPQDYQQFEGATEIVLPCGLYYLRSISGTGSLTLRATGRVALFVDGSIDLNDTFTIELTSGAELDLFVTGQITSSASVVLGDPVHPGRLRIYVGGSGSLNLSATSVLAGNLYAPRATLSISGIAEVFGALFVRQISSSSGLSVHYDESVRTASEDCPVVN